MKSGLDFLLGSLSSRKSRLLRLKGDASWILAGSVKSFEGVCGYSKLLKELSTLCKVEALTLSSPMQPPRASFSNRRFVLNGRGPPEVMQDIGIDA